MKHSAQNQNYLQLVLISSYLLGDSWFTSANKFGNQTKELLGVKLKDLANVVEAKSLS